MNVGKTGYFSQMRRNFWKYFWRSLAFGFDFSIALWPFYLLLSVPRLEYYQLSLDRFLIQSLKALPISIGTVQLLSCFFMILFICQIIRLYTTFFFGRSFGQILLGLKPQGSFGWVRLSGAFRIFIETLLFPLIVGHIFILIKGKSWHETLSASQIKFKLFKFRPVMGVICFIIMTFSALFSPSALNISDYHDFQYVKTKVEPQQINEETNFDKFNEMGSVTFGFSAFTSIGSKEVEGKNPFFLFPSVEVRKKGKRLIKSPLVYIVDRKSGSIGKLSIELKFDIENLLKLTHYANPFILKRYPELFQSVTTKSKKVEIDQESIQTIDEVKISNQFVDLVDQVFSLSLKEIPNKIFGLGPILLGPAKLRRKILRFLSNTASVQVQRVQSNKDRFLRLQQLFEPTENESFPFQETFIALEKLNGKVIQIKWGRSPEDAKSRELFQKQFLGSMGLIDTTWEERKFELNQDWNTFDIIDGIMKAKLSEAEEAKLRNEIMAKLLKASLILKSLPTNKSKKQFQKIVLRSINRFLFLQKNKKGHLVDSQFRNQLVSLKGDLNRD